MGDKYDDLIDSALAAPSGGDKYDAMIDGALKDAPADDGRDSDFKQFLEIGRRLFAPATTIPDTLKGMAKGFVGQEAAPDAGIDEKAGVFAGDPATLLSLATIPVTGGASIPARVALQAGAGAVGGALREGISQAKEGRDSTAEVLGEGVLTGATTGGVEALLGGAGKALTALRPKLVKLGAQLIRTTSGVPEKYGAAVLENPEILSKAPTMLGAREIYKAAVKDAGGMTKFLHGETGKLIPSDKSVIDLVNEAGPKLVAGTLGLEEAVASRQAVSFLLRKARYGNPDMRAMQSVLIGFKDELDEFVEVGLPGFRQANRGYFEANAKEAFQSWLPQNKNLSPNVLRSLGALASLSSGALMNAPALMFSAAPMSPKVTGLAIQASAKAVGPAALSARFAARIAASRQGKGDGKP